MCREFEPLEVRAVMAEGLAAGRVGAASGRQLVCDKVLQGQQEGAKPHSNIFTQVEDLGMGERALQMNHGCLYLLYLSPEMVLFPPLKMSSSSVDKT